MLYSVSICLHIEYEVIMSSNILKEPPKPSGKQIRKALIDLDLTVLDLARAMEVSPIYIRMIYQERRKATELRRRISRYLAQHYQRQGQPVPKVFNQNNKEKAA